MTKSGAKALLPAGLRDQLPPDSAFEARVVDALLGCFDRFGYERVKPPLVEFEENLLEGSGQAVAHQIFRLMDPVSQKMMGVRADMTIQVARIARTRLGRAPRPLRLSYAGDVLRVRGTELEPERQFTQVGAELIGSGQAGADVEVILLAAEALAAAGVEGLSIDLNAPPLVPAMCEALALSEEDIGRLRGALDHKDAAAIEAMGGETADLFGALLAASGPAGAALERLGAIDLPEAARAGAAELREVAERVQEYRPGLHLTIDPVEHRGFEYHTGVSFAIFTTGGRGELGRGGRYGVDDGGGHEPATGVTLFMHALMRALTAPPRTRRLFLPAGTPVETGGVLRSEGWITVAGLEAVADAVAEARRLDCTHVWVEGAPLPVDGSEASD